MSAIVPRETAFVIFQFFPIDHSIPAATQKSATGKRGNRYRGSPVAKNIPRLARDHTRTGILHSLVFLYARNTRGASASTVGPKKSHRPGFFARMAAKKRKGNNCAGLWLAVVPVALARVVSR